MTPSRYKSVSIKLFSLGLFLLLLGPLYMYFSYDVEELKLSYPHIVVEKESIKYEIKPSRPKNWVGLNEISSYSKWAIVLSEDWGFYKHDGIDVDQIKAAINDMVEAKRFRGASTITQQMVKNIFLTEDRTIWRKIHEMILAQKVEKVLTKSRILEIYLNVIEFGPDIYGIRNASYHYFRKNPSSINPREAAFLAMLLPSPKRYYISYRNKKLTKFARERVNAILAKMRMGKVISIEDYDRLKVGQMSWEK